MSQTSEDVGADFRAMVIKMKQMKLNDQALEKIKETDHDHLEESLTKAKESEKKFAEEVHSVMESQDNFDNLEVDDICDANVSSF